MEVAMKDGTPQKRTSDAAEGQTPVKKSSAFVDASTQASGGAAGGSALGAGTSDMSKMMLIRDHVKKKPLIKRIMKNANTYHFCLQTFKQATKLKSANNSQKSNILQYLQSMYVFDGAELGQYMSEALAVEISKACAFAATSDNYKQCTNVVVKKIGGELSYTGLGAPFTANSTDNSATNCFKESSNFSRSLTTTNDIIIQT